MHVLYYTFLTFFLSLVSCTNEKVAHEETPAITEQKDQEEQITPEEKQPEVLPSDSPVLAVKGLDFDFISFIVSIDDIMFDFEMDKIIQVKNDTCFYDLELGEEIENTELRISPMSKHNFISFEVYQRDIFHFTIGDEGPHCDLLDAAPYYTDWIKLKTKKANYSFHTLKWGDVKEPKVNMSDEDFEDLVHKHCGERWVNALHKDYISNAAQDHLATSAHELKIVATLLDGSTQTYYIHLSSMMGC